MMMKTTAFLWNTPSGRIPLILGCTRLLVAISVGNRSSWELYNSWWEFIHKLVRIPGKPFLLCNQWPTIKFVVWKKISLTNSAKMWDFAFDWWDDNLRLKRKQNDFDRLTTATISLNGRGCCTTLLPTPIFQRLTWRIRFSTTFCPY